jgi:monoamine oxidase
MADDEVQVAIIGGGAAGIAAAVRLREVGLDALLLEARPRLGGRAWTRHSGSAYPIDLGCGWLHSGDRNPWREIAISQGFAIDKTPPPWTRAAAQIGAEGAKAADFMSALRRFREEVDALPEGEPDRPAAAFLEPQNAWNPLIDAVSTYYSGAELARVSARDLARYDDDGVNWRVAEGYGRVIADYAGDVRFELQCEAKRIDRRGRRLRIETTRGVVAADAAIVTLPSNLLAERADFFAPALPDKTEAAAGLPLGLADKLFLSLTGVEDFETESRAFGRADRTETAAYHFRPFGRPMIEAYFGGALAAKLEAGGETAFVDFAISELVALFGAEFARRVAPLGYHGWKSDPFSRGSYSYALPGKADCRAALAEPVEDRLFFAGEACSPNDYSTAHGAYRTGITAADQAIAALRRRK